MMYVTLFLTVSLLVYSLFVWREDRKNVMKKRLGNLTDPKNKVIKFPEQTEKRGFPFVGKLFGVLWKEWKKGFKRNLDGQKEAQIERKLLQAGRPFNMSPVDYRMLQLFLLIVLPLVLGLYAMAIKLGFGAIVIFAVLGMGLAAAGPNFWLKRKITKRNRIALKELPDVLDLLTVSLEAGLGFDSALSKLVSRKEGVLSAEFQRCLEEIRLGRTRREALSGVKERLILEEINVLISSILQAEKLGIGMVQVLRVQSKEVREQRKQRAEEEAMKAPIKMLFPLVLFIFPSLFIVLLGPALIQFMQTFAK